MKISNFKLLNDGLVTSQNKIMKKLPLVFCCFLFACSSQRETIDNRAIFGKHQQPYHISSVGKWNHNYQIYTLIDAHDIYFTVKEPAGKALKKGDVYAPDLSTAH